MTVELGRYGIWRHVGGLTPEFAVAVEELGYGAIWIGGSPTGDLHLAESLLAALASLYVHDVTDAPSRLGLSPEETGRADESVPILEAR